MSGHRPEMTFHQNGERNVCELDHYADKSYLGIHYWDLCWKVAYPNIVSIIDTQDWVACSKANVCKHRLWQIIDMNWGRAIVPCWHSYWSQARCKSFITAHHHHLYVPGCKTNFEKELIGCIVGKTRRRRRHVSTIFQACCAIFSTACALVVVTVLGVSIHSTHPSSPTFCSEAP